MMNYKGYIYLDWCEEDGIEPDEYLRASKYRFSLHNTR